MENLSKEKMLELLDEEDTAEELFDYYMDSENTSDVGIYVDDFENMDDVSFWFYKELDKRDVKYRFVSKVRNWRELWAQLKKSLGYDVVVFENADSFIFNEDCKSFVKDAINWDSENPQLVKVYDGKRNSEISLLGTRFFFLVAKPHEKYTEVDSSLRSLMKTFKFNPKRTYLESDNTLKRKTVKEKSIEEIFDCVKDLMKNQMASNSIGVCSNGNNEMIEEFKMNLTAELRKNGFSVAEPSWEYPNPEKFILSLYGISGTPHLVIIDHAERYFHKGSADDYELMIAILNEKEIDSYVELNGKAFNLKFNFKDSLLKYVFIFRDDKFDIKQRCDKIALQKVGVLFEMPKFNYGKYRLCNYCGKIIPHDKNENRVATCLKSPTGKHRFDWF